MNIDSHQHFWRYDPRRDAWITDEMSVLKRDFLPEDLIPQLHANHVEGSIAVQAAQSEAETTFLLDLAGRFDEIKGVVGWVDLCAPNLPERLEHFSHFDKLLGFRHIVQSEPDDRFMLRPDFLTGIGQLQQFEFTYDILIYPRQLPAAIELVERIPPAAFRPRPSRQTSDSVERDVSLGGADPVTCSQPKRLLQVVRPYHGSGLAKVAPDRFHTVPGCNIRCLWDRQAHVRL